MKRFICYFFTVILMVVCMCVPVFAADAPPPDSLIKVDSVSGGQYWYIYYSSKGYYYLAKSSSKMVYNPSTNNIEGSATNYYWNGTDWVNAGILENHDLGGVYTSTVVASGYDIAKTTGGVFFSQPITKVAEALPPLLLPLVVKLVGVGILVLCSVTLGPRLVAWVPRLFLG